MTVSSVPARAGANPRGRRTPSKSLKGRRLGSSSADLDVAEKAKAYTRGASPADSASAWPSCARLVWSSRRWLLYDEPTSALDPARRRELVEVLAEVRAGGMTQIVVTHDHALVDAVADLVFDLDAGRLVARPR